MPLAPWASLRAWAWSFRLHTGCCRDTSANVVGATEIVPVVPSVATEEPANKQKLVTAGKEAAH